MTQSIGIEYTAGQWKISCLEQGQVAELQAFRQEDELLARVRQLCTQYPEPTIVVALDMTSPFLSLSTLSDEQLEQQVRPYAPAPSASTVMTTLRALRGLSTRSYCAPSLEYLPTVPLHRYLLRPALGSARAVCTVITLLHYMREQQAGWEEMNFCCVDASEHATGVVVISNGQIVNGIATLQGSTWSSEVSAPAKLEHAEWSGETLQAALEEAFWEGLQQELAGLLAIHHSEDLVVLGQRGSRLVERLAETYQVYLFPHAHTEREGYEAALGAALLAEGLQQSGTAAAVVEHLQLRAASAERLELAR